MIVIVKYKYHEFFLVQTFSTGQFLSTKTVFKEFFCTILVQKLTLLFRANPQTRR